LFLQVELHVHLDGALRIQTIIELAKYALKLIYCGGRQGRGNVREKGTDGKTGGGGD